MEKTASSSLAIVEKKPQRSGGCVGVFFQLFDWNRRFAKKKLFSKKFLPPVRLKQAAKKSGCNEKQPKLRLIADENSGGFPSSRKNNRGTNLDLEQRHEMRAPSLVAKLMGLESIPALHRNKSKKVPEKDKADKFVDNIHGYQKEESKNELRPQKLQKMSFCEKQQVTRFETETLQLKNVLSRSRKHHHMKLPVPVKSPRNFSRKNASKFIGAAATRILEPGLQTSRTKYALNYTNTPHVPPRGNSLMEETTFLVSNCDSSEGLTSEGQPSCKKCGHSLDKPVPKPCGNEKPLTFFSPSHSLCFPYEQTKPGISAYYGEFEEEFSSDRKAQSQNQTFRLMGRVSPRSNFKSQPCERVPIATSDDEAKNIVSFNRSSSRITNPRVSSRINNGKFEMEKRISNRQNETVPPGRKRRPTNISRQSETSILTNSTVKKQTCASTNENNTGVSFTFNSRSKQRSEVRAVARKRVQSDSRFNITPQMPALSENGGRDNNKFDKPFLLNGDALGALLEQKLRELNSQGEDIGGNAPKKTTAMILQELIAALTSETPFQHSNSETLSRGEVNISNRSHFFNNPTSYTSSKVNEMTGKLSVNQPLDSEHLSPGSVLEAYFSNNESCLSSSLDDSSGYKMLNEPTYPNSELWDSATSITRRKSSKELVMIILDSVSETLSCVNGDLKGVKLDHAKDVLLNSELMFQNKAHSGSVEQQKGFSIKDLLLNKMGTLATVLWMNFGSSIGVKDCKEVNQLKRFAFDSIVEYLELIFEKYLKSGCKMFRKIPGCVNTNMLFEIVQEVRRWERLSEFVLDELIEMEMSLSLGKWTQCESDAFDTSMEISKHVFQIVLDEILTDLCSS